MSFKRKSLFILFYLFALGIFWFILRDIAAAFYPQLDSVWLIPNVFQNTIGNDIKHIWEYLLSPSPYAYLQKQAMGDFSIKSWTAAILALGGPQNRYFI